MEQRENTLKLLGVFAHPDDESFGPGGTLARYAAEGIAVHICIATDGAAGSFDEKHLEGYETIAHRRADELERAVALLGATLHRLDYRDSGMEGSPENQHPASLVQAPLEEVGCRVATLMRQLRPQVVLTHDPRGDYFHPDHIKVSQAVQLAWEYVNNDAMCTGSDLPPWQPQRLFWTALPRTWIRWAVRILRLFRQDPTRFGRNKDIDLTRLGTPDELVHTRIDVRDFLPIKQAASRQHASQLTPGFPDERLPSAIRRRLFGSEFFTQAYPAEPRYATDLFEGLWPPADG
ncbi:MAG: PIG-L deacetylase family protein [Ardenticatenaceae bacterium]